MPFRRCLRQSYQANPKRSSGCYLFIPFSLQHYIHTSCVWVNKFDIIGGAAYDVNAIDEPLSDMWSKSMKVEAKQLQFQVIRYLETMKGGCNDSLSPTLHESIVREFAYSYLSTLLHGAEYNTNNCVVHNFLQLFT